MAGAGQGPEGGGFRRLEEEIVYRGSLVTLARATFVDPDGGVFERDIVHHPGAVVVVPVLHGGAADGGPAVLLVRQYRAAIGGELLELPAGKRDVHGEPPERTAAREMVEEIGMRAGRLEELAQFYNSPGYCDEHSHLYLARDLTPCVASPQGAEERHMAVERVALSSVAALIGGHSIIDAKTILGLSLARQALDREAAATGAAGDDGSEGGRGAPLAR